MALSAGAFLTFWMGYKLFLEDRPGKAVAYLDITRLAGPLPVPRQTGGVFRSRQAFDAFLQREGVVAELPPLDLRSKELVLVTTGPRSSNGYGVQVVGLTERRTSLLLTLRELSPTFGARVRPGTTYPFCLLLLPRSNKHVMIVWQGR